MEILELDEVDDIGDVSVEVYLRTRKVHPFAEAGEGDGVGVVAAIPESAGDGLPTPASEPSAPDQYVSSYLEDLLGNRLSLR